MHSTWLSLFTYSVVGARVSRFRMLEPLQNCTVVE
jgi:hypothetical protein